MAQPHIGHKTVINIWPLPALKSHYFVLHILNNRSQSTAKRHPLPPILLIVSHLSVTEFLCTYKQQKYIYFPSLYYPPPPSLNLVFYSFLVVFHLTYSLLMGI
jgi:hypothetical protein